MLYPLVLNQKVERLNPDPENNIWSFSADKLRSRRPTNKKELVLFYAKKYSLHKYQTHLSKNFTTKFNACANFIAMYFFLRRRNCKTNFGAL